MSAGRRGEECRALKEMPVSLWIAHLIKNTAADTSAWRGAGRKEKVETGTERDGSVVTMEGTAAQLDETTCFSRQRTVTYWGGRGGALVCACVRTCVCVRQTWV